MATEAAPTPRNGEFTRRAAAGIPAFLALVAVVWWAPLWVPGLVVAGAGVYGTLEYLGMVQGRMTLRQMATPMSTSAILWAVGAMGLATVAFGPAGLHGVLVLAVLAVLLLVLFSKEADSALEVSGLVLFGLVTVPWFLNHITLLLMSTEGRAVTLFLFLAVTFTDTLAYLVGKLMGRTPLLPSVSPNKTVEGALGGMVGGVLAGLLSALFFSVDSGHGLTEWLVLGAIVSAAAQCGDLVESRIKRLTGVKDAGSFLPGHGGLLDRMDSFLLAAPLLYYLHTLTL